MAAARRRWAAELLHFWFHTLRPRDWFQGGEAVDEALRRRFARDLAMLRTRPASEFLGDPATARAAVLLFDQVPRNIHRGSAFHNSCCWPPIDRSKVWATHQNQSPLRA